MKDMGQDDCCASLTVHLIQAPRLLGWALAADRDPCIGADTGRMIEQVVNRLGGANRACERIGTMQYEWASTAL